MRAVVQRVAEARVLISGREHARIGAGLLVLIGIDRDDGARDATYLAQKIVDLRVFQDERDRMNRSVLDVEGEILAVSQFTLLGDCRKGRRPSFERAAPPGQARELYEAFVHALSETGVPVSTGVFRAMMDVESTNSGPVTLLLDSGRAF
jgi:D-tyrosyl-tRNA(Tyr) deacylase